MLETLETSARRGADIVKQVLTFAKGVEGRHMPLQPGHLVKETAKIIQETFPKGITLKTDLLKSRWLVSGDATQLHQVLLNVINRIGQCPTLQFPFDVMQINVFSPLKLKPDGPAKRCETSDNNCSQHGQKISQWFGLSRLVF